MTKFLIISKNNNLLCEISECFDEHELEHSTYIYSNAEETFNFIKENEFASILIDDDIENYDILSKKIKSIENNDIFITLIYNPNSIDSFSNDFSGFIDNFIQKPICKNILNSTLNSYIKTKKNIDKYKEDNKELSRSLYQLDVLYNTSSKLSGNLDKEKLYEIMFETLEKTLSFDLASALIYAQNYDKSENKLIIHSLKKPENSLLEIIKEKIISIAKENNSADADFSKVLLEEHIKPSYQNQNLDTKLLNYDKLAAPIKIKDKTYATLLIYRNKPFSKEDVVCFQTIVHQISSPLRAITLYNEIKNTNIELKKLERIKSEFVSIVSHELRTPLAPINNSLDIVLSDNISDTTRHFANMAKRNVSRLSGIIEDLLDLSRIETGKFDFKYKKYNIKTSLDTISKTFENQIKEKEMVLKTHFEDHLPDIYADPKRIEQILSNLVTNAIKFTPKGGKIEISTKIINNNEINKGTLIAPIENFATCNFNETFINISIKDTGIGIKEEDINKIFDKFSQIENSLTRNAGGVGLGLTITKHFIDSHLGGIWVESKENEGSNFNVVIPVYSDIKAFEIDLNASKKINETTNLLTLKASNKESSGNFIKQLKEENIIKLTKNSKEIEYLENDMYIYKIYFPNLQKSAFDFMTNRIENSLKEGEYGIVLEKATYKKESEDYSLGM